MTSPTGTRYRTTRLLYFNESGEPSGPWDIDTSGTLALQVDGGPVTGSSVPEPSDAVLLATGFATLAGDLLRRRRTM
jgi:hypothetical protein